MNDLGSVDIRVQSGETTRIIVMARAAGGAGSAGATLTLAIRRDSDGYFWNGTTFQSAAATVTMTETDAVNLTGVYHYDLVTPVQFRGIIYVTTATAAVVNDPWAATIAVGYWLDNIDDEVSSRSSAESQATILSLIGTVVFEREFTRVRTAIGEVMKFLQKMKGYGRY